MLIFLFIDGAEALLQFGSVTSLAATLDEAAVWSLLTSQDLCISENHLFHLVKTWCARNQPETFLQMAMYIDFGQLTQEQVKDASLLCCTVLMHLLDSGVMYDKVSQACPDHVLRYCQLYAA